jgi:predicted Zn-dependent protease
VSTMPLKGALIAWLLVLFASPASAQLGGKLGKAIQSMGTKTAQELTFTEEEEREIGAEISARLREKYGVVQNAAVHRYVTLAGSVLARNSDRPNLKWTFIVLDTDGINAFAAPGGFIHITRGALALIKNEAELSAVLGHEVAHVTLRHTLNAIRNGKIEGVVAKGTATVTRTDFLKNVIDKSYSMTLENAFSSKEESAADEVGVTLSNRPGYAPNGLAAFLLRLGERYSTATERSGLYASHPETTKRLKALDEVIADAPLTGKFLMPTRYAANISYKLVPVSQVAQVAPPSAATATTEPEKNQGKGKSGMSGMDPLGKEKASSSSTSATGSRGVNPDRDAKGGPNKALVVVTVTLADVDAFVKGIAG